MSKEAFFDTLRVMVVIVVIVAAVVALVVVIGDGVAGGREKHCAALSERLGYETELISGWCYIKVRPGLKIRQDQVLDFLPVIDCRRDDG